MQFPQPHQSSSTVFCSDATKVLIYEVSEVLPSFTFVIIFVYCHITTSTVKVNRVYLLVTASSMVTDENGGRDVIKSLESLNSFCQLNCSNFLLWVRNNWLAFNEHCWWRACTSLNTDIMNNRRRFKGLSSTKVRRLEFEKLFSLLCFSICGWQCLTVPLHDGRRYISAA